ncbi:MAG: hypothetical protein P4L22_07120 [Candidatus Babeliales bacterium]|nr:hypothetical protein [Candidatus Babeliales bacterium]
MKKNIRKSMGLVGLILSVCLLSISVMQAKKHNKSRASCGTKNSCADLNNKCQCFCAFKHEKGEYRDKMPKQDEPVFFADPNKDKFGKGCYCASRDIKVLEAVANGMPIYKAREKYKNYYSPSEKVKRAASRLKRQQ